MPSPRHELDELSVCLRLARHPLSLTFKSKAVELGFLQEIARGRLPVLIATFGFDLFLLVFRLIVSVVTTPEEAALPFWANLWQGARSICTLYTLIALLHWYSKQSGKAAARAEFGIAALISAVLCYLMTTISQNSWIFVAFFIICTSTVLRLRWPVGAASFAMPVLIAIRQNIRLDFLAHAQSCIDGNLIPSWLESIHVSSVGPLPVQTVIHLAVAWAAGTLMGFLADDSRRQSYVSNKLALGAAATEIAEVRARVAAEKELASAQALAQAKTILVERERAANEAKSEFISMLCHEIRTPLNGCLASAEMLLETDLDDDQKDLAHTVRVSGSILLSTVSNFLDFFKLEAGKSLDIVRTPLHIGMLVADVHRIIEAMIGQETDVQLLPPDLTGTPKTCLGDPSRICGILLNMYMNAAKFTKRGSIGLKVRVVTKGYRPKPMLMEVQSAGEASSASFSGSGSEEDQNVAHGNLGNAQIRHDSVESLPNRQATAVAVAASTPAPVLPSQPSTPGAAAASPSVQMSIKDEGNGWLSTASLPQAAASAFDSHSDLGEVEWISFEVHDTGVGIAPKSLSALFHDYVQGDASEMEKPRTRSGTGLGLAICGRQVGVLGGVIGAVSKPGTGSIFWFKVPMVVPREGAELVYSAPERAAIPTVGGAKTVSFLASPRKGSPSRRRNSSTFNNENVVCCRSPGMKMSSSYSSLLAAASQSSDTDENEKEEDPKDSLIGLRVLVVEDNMINCKVACRVLQSLGIICESACNGQEAVDVIAGAMTANRKIDVVLMDMCMPVMGGVEATKSIRDLGCDIPIIAMTANALDKDKEECLAAGMNGFLSKPVLREQLAACIVQVRMDRFAATG